MLMDKLEHSVEFTVPATPERVFPLLCPVLEYRWIPTWQCELLHSDSGVAEEDTWLAGQSTSALDRMVETRRAELVHFLETGAMLKP